MPNRRWPKCAKRVRETSAAAARIPGFLKLHWPQRKPKRPAVNRTFLSELAMPQQQQPASQPSPSPPKKKKLRVPRAVNGVEQMVEIEVDDVSGPGWGPNDKHTLLNHPMARVDGPQKVSGSAKYTHDVRLPNMLFGRILRCPHAHARVKSFDSSKAATMPGVNAIIQARL